MYVALLHVTLIARVIPAASERYQFLRARNFIDVEVVASCATETAGRLFDPERRIDVIYSENSVEGLENAIAKAFSRNGCTSVADHPMEFKGARIPSYIVIEHDRFENSRRKFLHGSPDLRALQYLFVTKATREQVDLFARDMLLRAGYRDVAFLMIDDEAIGTITRANATGNEITLRSVGSCSKLTRNVDRIQGYAADSRPFCPVEGCTIKYGIVADTTVSFWRKEDNLELKHNETLKAVGALIMDDFGEYFNITIDSSAGISVPWPEAFRKLMNHEIDVVAGPRPEDPRMLEQMEVVCWYTYRDMVLVSLVRVRTIQNDILMMLTPFHYLVWVCVVLVFLVYALLLLSLRKLSGMGLIKERLRFAYVCAISLAQGVALPRNFGLRLVLLLWIVFSLYLSVTYSSTFTSSLAQVETEDLLQDLVQVSHSGQPLGGPSAVRSYFNDSDDQFIRDLYERYEAMGPEQALDSIFERNGIAVLQRFTVNRINWNYRHNRTRRMYSLPRPVFRFPVFYFARKGYIHRRPLRRFITKYRETGLLYRLENAQLLVEDKGADLGQSSDEILTMKHLRPIFEIYFICQAIGCLIFFVELFVARIFKAP